MFILFFLQFEQAEDQYECKIQELERTKSDVSTHEKTSLEI